MKKAILVALLMVIGACSDSDDPKIIDQDQIIGVWKPLKELEIYKDGTKDVYLSSVCELKNRFTFDEDGSFYATNFPESDDANCEELVGNLYQSGT